MQNLGFRNLIEASPLFRSIQPDEAEAILARLEPAHYERGARILKRGVWHGRLYVIASGQVSVLLRDEDGGEQALAAPAHPAQAAYVVAYLGSGECFGEMSLITGEVPTATIRAEHDTTLWSLTQADFLALIGICPTLSRNINGILSQRLARANQHLVTPPGAEILLLACFDPQESILPFHIAEALATHTAKRVLVLELCGHDEARGMHFALHQQQVRPSLLECLHDHTLLEAHRAPLLAPDGQHMPAIAALAQMQEQVLDLEAHLLLSLTDLALLYDFILLVSTQLTPAPLVETLLRNPQEVQSYAIKRAIALVSAYALKQYRASPLFELASSSHLTRAIFVTDIVEQPTIGAQDHYTQLLSQPVTRLLPADDALLEQCRQQGTTPRQLAPQASLTRAIDFVARSIARQTVGIAFGGGAARGFAHLGILERLLAHGVPLDYIAACSSGIIAPGMYLVGKSSAESEAICLEIQRHLVQWSFPRSSIFSNRGLKRMLRAICGEARFEDLTTPFAMVAADLTTRAGVVLDRGLLWQAGLASVSIPGIFPPVVIGKHMLIDAGIHDPVPVRLVRQMGADILIAAELGEQEPPRLESATPWLAEAALAQETQSPMRTPHIIDILLRSYDLAMATVGMHSIREADVVIRPKLHRVSLRQFSEGRKFISAGRDAVEQALPALRQRLSWL